MELTTQESIRIRVLAEELETLSNSHARALDALQRKRAEFVDYVRNLEHKGQ